MPTNHRLRIWGTYARPTMSNIVDTIFDSHRLKSNGRVGFQRSPGWLCGVSTDDQELSLQLDSLVSLGVNQVDIFTDKVSGSKTKRPGLDACLAHLKQGDTLVVWRLDRLGRSMHHLVELIEELRNRGVGFRSVSDGLIDTTSPSGELIFHIFSRSPNSSGV